MRIVFACLSNSCLPAVCLCMFRWSLSDLELSLQDERVMSAISSYFNKKIEEIEWDNEDVFIEVLNKCM
jgi:hypothetical protein